MEPIETRLGGSEEQLGQIISFLPDPTMVVDRAGTVIAWNRAMEDLSGRSADEMVGRGDHAYALPFYGERRPMLVNVALGAPDAEALYEKLQRDGDTVTAEVDLPDFRAGGAILWCTARPLRDSRGEVVGAVEAIRDVTDQRRTEEALRDSEARYRLLAENQRDVVVAFTSDGTLTYCSPAVKEFSGADPEDVVGRNLFTFIATDEDRRRAREVVGRAVRKHEPGTVEFMHQPLHGDPFPVEATGKPVVEDGRAVSVQAVLRDVTARKRAEEDLQRFKNALENSTDAIGISTPAGVHYYQNETFTRMFGDIGNDPPSTIYLDRKVGREVFDAITSGEEWSGEVEMYGKDRNVLSILLRAYPVKKEGRIIAVVGVHTDITARKRAEEALRERIKELKGLNGLSQLATDADIDVNTYLAKAVRLLPPAWQHSDVASAEICLDGRRFQTDPDADRPWRQRAEIRVRGEARGHVEVGYRQERPEADEGPFHEEERTLINTMAWQLGAIIDRMESRRTLAEKARQLQRSNAELQEFAYVASHDLQEPLRMVASYVQLLEKRYADALDDEAKEFIGYAVDGAKRMQALINDLLQYSRVGTKGKPFTPTDCETLLEEVLSNLEVAITEAGARVTHDPLPTVLADRAQLARVFQNLIGNALKFCDQAPEIHVSAERDGGEWRLAVRDNGIGIDPAQHEKIFVVFQRLHGRQEYAGTGMGLAIAKRIVERHGGGIRVESDPGAGTTFTFTIPDRKESSDGHEHGAGNDEPLAVACAAGGDPAG